MMHCGKTALLIYLRIDLIHLLHFHDHFSSMQSFKIIIITRIFSSFIYNPFIS